MGSCDFVVLSHGKTASQAFDRVADEARYEYGHEGYTGTIAEKSGFVVFDLPSRVMASKVLAALQWAGDADMEPVGSDAAIVKRARRDRAWLVSKFGEVTTAEMIRRYNDKWGPAVGFQVTGKQAERYRLYNTMKRGERVWLFCGWASS